MPRIESIGMEPTIPKAEKVNPNNKKAINKIFKQKLEKIQQDEIKEVLQNLYNKIENQRIKLQDRLFIQDLIEYKKLVKDFLNITISNSHIFYKENSLDRRGRHRVFSLVKQVDKELDSLTKDFINIEENRIQILKRLDGIKGLLLDILT